MATIVQDETNGKRYVLLGVGYGEGLASRPTPFMPVATSNQTSQSEQAALANHDGEISWLPSYRLTVLSVDGVSCADLLSSAQTDGQSTPTQ